MSLTDINDLFIFNVLMEYIETHGYDDYDTMKVRVILPVFFSFQSFSLPSFFFFGGGGGK